MTTVEKVNDPVMFDQMKARDEVDSIVETVNGASAVAKIEATDHYGKGYSHQSALAFRVLSRCARSIERPDVVRLPDRELVI